MNLLKKCGKCFNNLELKYFYKRKGKRNDYFSYCIECCKRYNKNEDRQKYFKEYRKNNKERINKISSDWVKNNPERQKKRVKEWYNDNKELHSNNVRNSRLKYRFGITAEVYDLMLLDQNGVCAICNKECKSGNRLAIDHDHKNGNIRGLLCRDCNTSLGKFNDDPEILRKALDYLIKHRIPNGHQET